MSSQVGIYPTADALHVQSNVLHRGGDILSVYISVCCVLVRSNAWRECGLSRGFQVPVSV